VRTVAPKDVSRIVAAEAILLDLAHGQSRTEADLLTRKKYGLWKVSRTFYGLSHSRILCPMPHCRLFSYLHESA